MLKYILNVVIYLSLAVWIGSLVFFGAGVASLVFQSGMLPDHTMAGELNSAILDRLRHIEIVAGVLLLGGTFYTAFRYRHWLNWLVLVIALGMLGTAGYYSSVLYPKMEGLRKTIGNFDNIPAEKMELKAEFDRGHVLYSTLVKGVLGGGVLVLILHTIAFVRYTELHASRYRRLENDWRQLTEKGSPADAAGEQRATAPQKSIPEAIPKKPVAAT
ncbi:MAG: DUF4149 domain-containing protein [Candidatus Kapaibacterium sp.]